jgi:hypothetical protein
MTIDVEAVPGVKIESRRSYIYVRCGRFSTFRRFFESIKIVLGAPQPKSGSMMNAEVELITPTGDTYCAISLVGDQPAWRKVVIAYCASVDVATAQIEARDLVLDSGERIPLELCTLASSHGL